MPQPGRVAHFAPLGVAHFGAVWVAQFRAVEVAQFDRYKHPNNGAFHVGIELTEEMPITVSIWHAPSGILIRQVQKSGDNQYTLYFDLKPLTSGTYVLRLDYVNGKKYIRFVVN